MAEMGVSTRRVKRVLRHPEVTRPGALGHKDGRTMFLGDGIGVIVQGNIVVTVIWDTREEFHRRQRYLEAS